jgi:glycine/D-amino acid oxidase-like deaminating enzyme
VVIGCGIAGVSVAYELAAHCRVTLLEAETSLAIHSTGRSAAMYVPGHGGPQVRALIKASRPRFARLAEELGAPALLHPRPVLRAAFDDDGAQKLRAELAEQAHEPDAAVELSPEQALARCPALRRDVLRAVAVTEAACDLDVMALHQAYVRGLRQRGGCVQVGRPSPDWLRYPEAGGCTAAQTGCSTPPTSLTLRGPGPTSSPAWPGYLRWVCARCAARSSSRECPTWPGCAPRAEGHCRW